MQDCMYLTASDIQELLGVSRSKAYKIVKMLNEELEAKGYFVIAGRTSRKFFLEKFYGFSEAMI